MVLSIEDDSIVWPGGSKYAHYRSVIELETKLREVLSFTITEEAFFLLK